MDTMKDTKMQPAKDAVIEELRMLAAAEESRMKPLVIYHANCTDGFGAAFAAWLKLGDSAEYLPMEYNQALPEQLHSPVGLELYILDFSFRRDQMDTFFKYAKRVVWLDHHKTSFEMWLGATPTHGQYVLGVPNTVWLDNNKSGAMLAWEYFHPGTEVPRLIQHIADRDRWQFKLDGSKEFHAANPAVTSELLNRLEAAEKERDDLRAKIEQMEIGKREISEAHNVAKRRLSALAGENIALQAKIAEMEKQEPVAWLHESRRDSDVVTSAVKHVWGKAVVGALAAYSIPLYLAPGAQGEPK